MTRLYASFRALSSNRFCYLTIAVVILISASGSLVAAEMPAKMSDCIICHGLENSLYPEYPTLAGQNTQYIYNRLKHFREKRGADPRMLIMVDSLSDREIAEISIAYSNIEPKKHQVDKMLSARGRLIYENTCKRCHGSKGEGNERIARVGRQGLFYLLKQLMAFNSGQRQNSEMSVIAKRLTRSEIESLAAYVSGL